MSEYLVKGKILKTNHVWFDEVCVKKKGDWVVFHGVSEEETKNFRSSKFCKIRAQHTLFSDIFVTENEIFSHFSPTVRNEINRSKKEKTKSVFITSEEFLKSKFHQNSFANMYSEMYQQKGMSVVLNIAEVIEYAKNGDLLVTAAYMNEQPVVYHSYITQGENARLLHSCSEFRVTDKDERNFIGRANKYLHFADMLYLKNRGVKYYDWGGIASFEKSNGIDKFKMAFGGTETTYYNITIARSFIARCKQMKEKILGK